MTEIAVLPMRGVSGREFLRPKRPKSRAASGAGMRTFVPASESMRIIRA
jgi:hypothetical protein